MFANLPSHYIFPGELTVKVQPTVISTVLGSCISVCLWDEEEKIGGLNHFVLPLWNGEGLASPKYGNIAMEKLIKNMLRKGACLETMTAKVFGGASIITKEESVFSIGKQNILMAEDVLNKYEIPIVASSVGGNVGRSLKFVTNTGDVFVKRINK